MEIKVSFQLSSNQFNMWLRARSFIFVGLFILLQINVWAEKPPEDFHGGNERIFQFQKSVERLIGKILRVVKDFYDKIKNKCIPEDVPDAIMEILKHSVDCLSSYEENLQKPHLTKRKFFYRCLGRGKKEFQDLMNNIDPTLIYCPENITEKIYQINITTTFTKTFNINIKNGLEITRKIIYFENGTLDKDKIQSPNESEQNDKDYGNDEFTEYDHLKDYYKVDEYVDEQSKRKLDVTMDRVEDNENSSVASSLEKNRRPEA